jgi:hypothetical protein
LQDYTGDAVNAEMFLKVLAGNKVSLLVVVYVHLS